MKLILGLAGLLICTTALAADLHPIVELRNGFLLGASSDGKWIKADKAVKTLGEEATYHVYGLTESLGEIKGDKPKPSQEDVCSDRFAVEFSPKPEHGEIAIAAPWNALPRKPRVLDPTQKVYVDAIGDFLKTKGIAQPKVKIESIVRIDLDGDGEPEVLISATNYFEEDNSVPMRSPAGSYSAVLLRRVVKVKVQTQVVTGEFYPKATGFTTANAYKLIAVLDLDGDGKLELVVYSQYYEGAATTIYRCGPKKVEAVLSVGCGA